MRYLFLLLLLSFFNTMNGQNSAKLHKKAVLADTHNDVLTELVIEGVDISKRSNKGHSDLERWKEGGLDIQFFSVWTDEKPRTPQGFFNDAKAEIDSLYVLVLRNPTKISLATNYREVRRGLRQDKIVALIGVEGGHMIENDIERLKDLHRMGMSYLTLTWNNSTPWASSARDETASAESNPVQQKGLNEFGKNVVRKMNELGIIVDLSHVGEQTFYDAINTSTKPVMLSHSSVWNICPVFRNVKDDQIRAVAKNKGVICINFYSGFISKEYDQRLSWLIANRRKPFYDSLLALKKDSGWVRSEWQKYFRNDLTAYRPTLAQLVDHIDYIVKLVGDEYVGIGSDYDGISSLPIGMEDVTTYPKITEELLRRGYSKKSIKRILGGNVLRVMKANLK